MTPELGLDTVQHTWNENHDWRITCLFFLFEAFNPCQINVAQKKNTNTNDMFFVGKHGQQNKPFDRNSFFSVSVWTKHGKQFPSKIPKNQPAPTPKAPTDASCSIHGSKCAGSRNRIELRQLVYLKVGGPRADFFLEMEEFCYWGGPYKMAENHCGFFYPYKMEVIWVIPIFQSISFYDFYANLRFCSRFSEAELV